MRRLFVAFAIASGALLLSFANAQAQIATTTQLILAPNPSAAGELLGLTAIVAPATPVTPGGPTPTGTVTFFDNGSQIGTATITSEEAFLSIGTLSVGSHTITTSYAGDANFSGSNGGPVTQVVNKNNTKTQIFPSPSPSNTGQTVGFDIVISPVTPTISTVFPTGTVTVFVDGNQAATLTLSSLGENSSATFVTSTLSAGSHTITTSYAGDANFNGSNGSIVQIVNQATGVPSTTGVTSSPNPSTFGQSVTFTATVASAAPGQSSATPTGTVAFLDGGNTIGSGTLSGGVATFTTSALAVGSHTITADYSGDATFATSTGTLTGNPQVVNKSNSSTTITSSPNPSVLGQLVTFNINVSAASPGAVTPTGTVTILDGGASIGTTTLSGTGSAIFTTSTLVAGSHSITAMYNGDGNFNTSTGTLTGNPQVVNKANPTITLSSSLNPSSFNQTVTFTATITGTGAITPTGTVTFTDQTTGQTLGTVSASGSGGGATATLSISTLTAGSHNIQASYSGDGNFNSGTASLTGNPQVVNKANTLTGLVPSPNPSTFGQSVTFTATVSGANGGTPTGSVTFTNTNTGQVLATVALTSGQAVFTTSALAGGIDNIQASYGGDGNFTASSTSVNQTVNKANTTTTVISSLNPSAFGQTVTFTATVSAASGSAPTPPTGTVTFTDTTTATTIGTGTLSSGTASVSTSTLTAGNHNISATYNGDNNFIGSTGALNTNPQVVTRQRRR